MSEPCRIRQGLFGRWYIFHPGTLAKGWSGSQWAGCSEDGYPTGMFQVCNFESEQEARDYCREHGLEPQ